MRNCRTIDIEGALVDALENDYSISAPPVPANMTAPHVHVVRLGGSRRSYVQDAHSVSFHCYGKSWKKATDLADELTEVVSDFEGGWLGGVPCYKVDITTLPYNNPDPDRGDLARVTFSAQVVTRVSHVTQES